MDWASFFVLHQGLQREGPGAPGDVLWALDIAGTRGAARICDAGCGPGADSEVMAEALPGARIDALDLHAPFAEATAARCTRFGGRVQAWAGPMEDLSGPYDLIWCAGALYFLGVTEGLTLWRKALAPGGRVAFSEPVLLGNAEPEPVRAFWQDYPAITDEAGIVARVEAAGYRHLASRLVIGDAWEGYYTPLEARIAALRAAGVSDELEATLSESEREIAAWRAGRERIAYLLSVVEPA